MTFPTKATSIRHMMWYVRLPYLPDVQVTSRETRNVANQTGAVMSSVSMLEYPRVLTIDGKKNVNVCDRFDTCCNRTKTYTLGSLRANLRPSKADIVPPESASPVSSIKRHRAYAFSSAERKRVDAGKSGSIAAAMKAIKIVIILQ